MTTKCSSHGLKRKLTNLNELAESAFHLDSIRSISNQDLMIECRRRGFRVHGWPTKRKVDEAVTTMIMAFDFDSVGHAWRTLRNPKFRPREIADMRKCVVKLLRERFNYTLNEVADLMECGHSAIIDKEKSWDKVLPAHKEIYVTVLRELDE